MEYKEYIEIEITKDNAKEIYIELEGQFSHFLFMLQCDVGDYYTPNGQDKNSSIEGDDGIKRIFEEYNNFINFESNLMDKYLKSDSKYNLIGKFKKLGFSDNDFLEWNKDILNNRLDKYYSEEFVIKKEQLPYCDLFYDSKFTTLANAFSVYTIDYSSNKRLLDAIKDYFTRFGDIVYGYYDYWKFNTMPNKDDIHPLYVIDNSLVGNTENFIEHYNDKANPQYVGYYHDGIEARSLEYRFKSIGYNDLLEGYNEIIKLREKLIGPLTFQWSSEDDGMTLLDVYKEVFDSQSICCPYYGIKSYEMEKLLEFSSNVRNFFIEYDKKVVGAITYENKYINKEKIRKDIYIKCICIYPSYQEKGIGTRAMEFIFNSFIKVDNFYIDIPKDNSRLIRFFENKCGMRLLRDDIDSKVYTFVKSKVV